MGKPWITIVGLPDDSLSALPPASRAAIDAADVIFGGPRHLDLVSAGPRGRAWPVPFSIDPVLAARGQHVVVLASGDPFWFGVGGSLAARLQPEEWQTLPAPSTFALVAARLGWRLEEITCHGLHAAPFDRLWPVLAPHGRMICLVRDGSSPAALAEWLTAQGAGASRMFVCEAMGGPDARVREARADAFALSDIAAPVAVGVALPGSVGHSAASGLPDDLFASDGQITKRPVRALTLSALAPRRGELLWDLGAGSGSISVEWCLAGGRSFAVEQSSDRAENIRLNAGRFGVDHRLTIVEGKAADQIRTAPKPDAVFVGGGATQDLLDQIFDLVAEGTRLVVNGVTLETEALLSHAHSQHGGSLMRFELAQAAPLGRMRGWQSARPIVQWAVTR